MAINFNALISGVFLFNAIPHLVRGICGKTHMTPFGRTSSPSVNVVWGWTNLLIGWWLLNNAWSMPWTIITYLSFCIGGFSISIILSLFWADADARLPWHRK